MRKTIIGSIFAIVGLMILFNILTFFSNSFMAPLIFLALGVFFVRGKKRKMGKMLMMIALILFISQLLHISLITVVFALVFIYVGLKLVRSEKQGKKEKKEKRKVVPPVPVDDNQKSRNQNLGDEQTFIKRSLIGEVRFTSTPFELTDMQIWNGVGDVRIDLTNAIIPEGETLIIVENVIGDVQIYMPEDLEYTIQSYVLIGDSSILQSKKGGFNQTTLLRSTDYQSGVRKVKFVLSCAVGSVKVREI
ncbi:cell wall-active antibiotics response protein LiaF [Alkalihalobacillus sp. FSL R5-0424]